MQTPMRPFAFFFFAALFAAMPAYSSESPQKAGAVQTTPHLSHPGLEMIFAEFEEATNHVSYGDWDYGSAIYQKLRVPGTEPLSRKAIEEIVAAITGRPVALHPVSLNETGFLEAKEHACHSGYVNDHCGGLTGIITEALSSSDTADTVTIYAGRLRDAHMSHGYAVFYDASANEILLVGSGYLHTM